MGWGPRLAFLTVTLCHIIGQNTVSSCTELTARWVGRLGKSWSSFDFVICLMGVGVLGSSLTSLSLSFLLHNRGMMVVVVVVMVMVPSTCYFTGQQRLECDPKCAGLCGQRWCTFHSAAEVGRGGWGATLSHEGLMPLLAVADMREPSQNLSSGGSVPVPAQPPSPQPAAPGHCSWATHWNHTHSHSRLWNPAPRAALHTPTKCHCSAISCVKKAFSP